MPVLFISSCVRAACMSALGEKRTFWRSIAGAAPRPILNPLEQNEALRVGGSDFTVTFLIAYCRLNRIGGGPQLCELRRQFATLYQLGVAPNYFEVSLLSLAPKTDGDFVLTYSEIIHG